MNDLTKVIMEQTDVRRLFEEELMIDFDMEQLRKNMTSSITSKDYNVHHVHDVVVINDKYIGVGYSFDVSLKSGKDLYYTDCRKLVELIKYTLPSDAEWHIQVDYNGGTSSEILRDRFLQISGVRVDKYGENVDDTIRLYFLNVRDISPVEYKTYGGLALEQIMDEYMEVRTQFFDRDSEDFEERVKNARKTLLLHLLMI